MTKLGQDRVEHDARVGIVLGAQHMKASCGGAALATCTCANRGRVRCRLDKQDAERERTSLPYAALHREIAAHRFREPLREGEPKARAAEPACDLCVRLTERPEQPRDLRLRKPDTAVGHDETQPMSPARAAQCADR